MSELTVQAMVIVDDFLEQSKSQWGQHTGRVYPKDYAAGITALDASPELRAAILAEAWVRFTHQTLLLREGLMKKPLVFDAEQIERFVSNWNYFYHPGKAGIQILQNFLDSGNSLPIKARERLSRLREDVAGRRTATHRKFAAALSSVLGDEEQSVVPDATDEVWAKVAVGDLAGMNDAAATLWKRLFALGSAATETKPSASWLTQAQQLTASLGVTFLPTVIRWMSALCSPEVTTQLNRYTSPNGMVSEWTSHTPRFSNDNVTILKGLAWCCAGRTEPEVARALEKMTVACLAKLPGTGPWAVRAASAAVYALSESPDNPEAVPSLARLKTKVTYKTTLAQIEKALDAVAKRRGITKDDLEDLSVPTYGLGRDGVRRELFAAQ